MPIPLDEITNTQTGGEPEVKQFQKVEKIKPVTKDYGMGSDKINQEIQRLESQNQRQSQQLQQKSEQIATTAAAMEPPAQQAPVAVTNDDFTKRVYNWAVENKRTAKSFDQFKSDWFTDEAKTQELYDKLSTTAKFQSLPFDVGSFDNFKKNISPVKTQNTLDVEKSMIQTGVTDLMGTVEKNITDATESITELPTMLEEVTEEVATALPDEIKNPVAESPDADAVLSGADTQTKFKERHWYDPFVDEYNRAMQIEKDRDVLNPLKTFGLTQEYKPENVQKEITRIEAELNKKNQYGRPFRDEYESYQNVLKDRTLSAQGKSVAEKFLADNKKRYEHLVSELDYQKSLLPKEGKQQKDPFETLVQPLLSDVKSNIGKDNYEFLRGKWIADKKYTEDQINLAEQKIALDQQTLKNRKALYDPKNILNFDAFYAEKKKLDEAAWKVYNSDYKEFSGKISSDLRKTLLSEKSKATEAAKTEIQEAYGSINKKYQSQFDNFVKTDASASEITDRYRAQMIRVSPDQKAILKQQYQQELSQLPGYNKIIEAQKKELDKAQKDIIGRHDKQLQSLYTQKFSAAEKEFQDKEKEWLAKIYDPKILDKTSLDTWLKSVNEDMENMDFNTKQKYLVQEKNKYFRHLASKDAAMAEKLANPALRKQAEKEFYFRAAGNQMQDKRGNPSAYAIKTWAENQLEIANEQLEQVRKQKQFSGTESFGKDIESGDVDVMVSKARKIETLNNLVGTLEKIVDHPETDEGFWSDFGRGFTSNEFVDYIPVISTFMSIDKSMNIKDVADRLSQGKTLRPEEQSLLNSLAAQRSMNDLKPTSTGFNVGKGIAETIPVIGEFALSSGFFTGGKNVTKKAITNQIEKSLEKSFEKQVAKGVLSSASGAKDKFVKDKLVDLTTKGMSKYTIDGLSTFVGVMSQTAVGGSPQIIDKTIQRMTPQVALMYTDEGNKIEAQIVSKGEDFGEAFWKSTGSTFSEFLTERLGGHILKLGDNAISKIVGNQEWAKRGMIGAWMNKRGIKNPDIALNTIIREKLGWNGIVEEFSEEYANNILDALITGDHSPFMSGQEALETALTVGILGGGVVKPVRFVGEMAKEKVKDYTHNQVLTYSRKNPDGTEAKSIITMPRHKWNEYVKMLNKSTPIAEEQLDDFLQKLNVNEEHMDALKENYYTQNKPKIEAAKEQAEARTPEIPEPTEKEDTYGYNDFVQDEKFSNENPIKNIPSEVYDLTKTISSGKESKDVNQEQLYNAEKWGKTMREVVIKSKGLSEEEKQQSLEYLNNVIATAQAENEISAKDEDGGEPIMSESDVPVVDVTKTATPAKTKPAQKKVSKEEVSEQKEALVKTKKAVVTKQTEKLVKAQEVLNKSVAEESVGEFETAVQSYHAIAPLETSFNEVNQKMEQLQQELKTAVTGSKRKNVKARIDRLKPEFETKKSALNNAKVRLKSEVDAYAFVKGIKPQEALLAVKSAPVEPVETISKSEAPVVNVKEKQTAQRQSDIQRLDSPETFEEAIDEITLDENEITSVQNKLGLQGKFASTTDLFKAYKKSGGDTGTFYDSAKTARIETVASKEKARQAPVEKAKQIEEEKKIQATKTAAEGTIIDKREPRKSKTVVSPESAAISSFNKEGKGLEKKADKAKNPTVKKFMESIAGVMMDPKSFYPGVKIGEITKVRGEFYQVALKKALSDEKISQADFDALNKLYYDYRSQLDKIKDIRENPDLMGRRFYAQQAGAPTHNPTGTERIRPALYQWKEGESKDFAEKNTVSKIITEFSNKAKLLTVFTRGAKKTSPKGMYDATQKILFLIDKGVNNMDIYSHEFGHHVDTLYELSNKAKAMDDSPFKDELFKELETLQSSGPTQVYEDRIEEAMAELGRAMIINPTTVQQQYPKSFEFFNKNVDKDMRSFIGEMGDSFRKAYSLSDMEKGVFNLSLDGKTTAEIKNVGSFINNTGWIGKTYILFAKYFLNKNYPLLAAMRQLGAVLDKDFTPEQSFEALFRLFAGNNQKINSFLRFGLRDAKLNIEMDGNQPMNFAWLIGEDVIDFNNEKDLEYLQKQLFAYMLAKRTVELAENKYAREVMEVSEDFAAAKEKALKKGETDIRYANDGEMISMFHAAAKDLSDKEIVKNLENIQKKYEKKREKIKKENQKEIDAINQQEIEEINKIARQEMGLTGIGTGFESELELAKNIVNTVETTYKATNQKLHSQITELSRRYKKYADTVLKYAMDSGRISEEDYNRVKASNSEYVALKRINDLSANLMDDPETVMFKKPTIRSSKDVTKKIKGSRKEVINPYIGLMDNVHTIIRESDRNKVMVAGVNMFDQLMKIDPESLSGFVVKNPDETKIPKGRAAFKVFKEGKEEQWYFVDPYIQDLFTVLQRDENMVWKVMSFIPNVIRSLITSTPTFAVRNFIRDWQDRFLQSKTSSSFGGFSKYKETEAALAAAGGSQTMYYSPKTYYDTVSDVTREVLRKKDGTLDIIFSPKKWRPRGWYLDKLRYSEQSNRVAEYNNAYKKYETKYYQRFKDEAIAQKKANGEPLDLSPSELEGISNQARYNAMLSAGLDARDLLDFAVAGKWIEQINRVVPFTNAGIQGQKRFYKALFQDKGFTASKMLVYNILAEMAFKTLQSQMGDDDEYEELPDYEKDMFWMIKAGPNVWIRVPKPYESSVFGNITNRMYDYWSGRDENALDGEYFDNWFATYAWKKTAGTVATNPFAANSVIDLMFLYDSFRNQSIIDSEESEKLLRKRFNFGKGYGNWTSNKVMEFASAVGLDSDYADAKAVDFAQKTLFGEWGQFMNGLINMAVDQEKGPGINLKTTKFVSESPALYGKSITKAHEFQDQYALNYKDPEFRVEKKLKEEYYAAKTNEQADAIAAKLRAFGKALRSEYEYREEHFKNKETGEPEVNPRDMRDTDRSAARSRMNTLLNAIKK